MVKTSGIGFKDLPKVEELRPGIRALGLRVLVLAKALSDTHAIKREDGSIFELEIRKTAMGDLQRQEDAGSEGMLVSMGDQAGYERWPKKEDGTPDYLAGHPGVGDVVLFGRYSGKHAEFTGDDGLTYRMMNDEDLLGLRDGARPAAYMPQPQLVGAGAIAGGLKGAPLARSKRRA